MAMSNMTGRKTRQERQTLSLLKPDKISYQTIVGTLSKVNPPTAKAAELAEILVSKSMQKMKYSPNLITCNTVLNCWTRAGLPEEAEAFLKTMTTDLGVHPDTVSFNAVVHAHANSGDSQRALELLQGMLRDHLQHCSSNDSEGTKEAEKNFLSNDVGVNSLSVRLPRPNARTFTAILAALARECTIEAAEEAEELLLQMKDLSEEPYNLDTRPGIISYNAVLNCWCSVDRAQNEKRKVAVKRAEQLLHIMKDLGPDEQPNVISYNTMIKGYGNSTTKAEKCVREMISRGIQPNQSTYQNLLKVLQRDRLYPSQEEKTAKAIQIQQMYKFGANGLPRSRPKFTNRS
jgi:pentatricopeptide repeat protein